MADVDGNLERRQRHALGRRGHQMHHRQRRRQAGPAHRRGRRRKSHREGAARVGGAGGGEGSAADRIDGADLHIRHARLQRVGDETVNLQKRRRVGQLRVEHSILRGVDDKSLRRIVGIAVGQEAHRVDLAGVGRRHQQRKLATVGIDAGLIGHVGAAADARRSRRQDGRRQRLHRRVRGHGSRERDRRLEADGEGAGGGVERKDADFLDSAGQGRRSTSRPARPRPPSSAPSRPGSWGSSCRWWLGPA